MDEYVEAVKDNLEESISFFGNKNKQGRELLVLREFLSHFLDEVNESDVVASEQEPNDAFYKNHGFQIKEVLSEGRKRGKEYKDKLNFITNKTKPEDLNEPYSPPVHVPLSESLPYVMSELARHREDKYDNDTADINVLVYLNLSNTTYTGDTGDTCEYRNSEFSRWKSISMVGNNNAIVLACKDKKDKLLSELVGKLFVKKEPGWNV